MVMLGSCFAKHMGSRFWENRLCAVVNPLGVVYNPMSIVRLLTAAESDAESDFSQREGMWHTWLGSSLLSRPTKTECMQATNDALRLLHETLARADRLFLTFGTSRCYQLRNTENVVANCHRFPAAEFIESEMSVEEMLQALDAALTNWHERNPRLKVVLTVSPYRYAKYGFHESQLSKARLLLMVDALCKRHSDWIDYFPAYEIVMDELRDYRFYASDMLHPSEQAVDYIWQRLREDWMSDEMNSFLDRYRPILLAENHRPLVEGDPANMALRQRIEQQRAELQKDYPYLKL